VSAATPASRRGVLDSSGRLNQPKRFTIPTHVHVITASDGSGGVTTQQVRDQIQVLNDAYSGRTSPRSTSTPFSFKLVSIDVTADDAWFNWGVNEDGTETSEAVAALADPYLGYAALPTDGVLALDGDVLFNENLPGGSLAPFNLGDTGTHEIGHWLGLTTPSRTAAPSRATTSPTLPTSSTGTTSSSATRTTTPAVSRAGTRCTRGQGQRMIQSWLAFRA
jgi:hypothetical protein